MAPSWQRLKGGLGLALAWAFTWFAAGMLLLLVVGPDAADVPFPLGFGLLGFLAGLAFSGVLVLVDGRRSFQDLSLPRFAGWGAAGGILLGLVMTVIVGPEAFPLLATVFGLAGAACATGSLALARLGDDPPILDPGTEAPPPALTRPDEGGKPLR